MSTRSKVCGAFTLRSKACEAFTLIEILVAVAVVGIVLGVSLFGVQGSRLAGRDARRKSDLENIRSGLELFRADCGKYPTAGQLVAGQDLVGDGSSQACSVQNKYITSVPTDPVSPRVYAYVPAAGLTPLSYTLCAALENVSSPPPPVPNGCPGGNGCGGTACNYKVINP